MGHTLKNQSGASIIEILITLVIITIITMLIMSFSRSTLNMSKDSRAKDAAYLAAEEKIAELKTKVLHTSPFESNVTIDNIPLHLSWTIADVNTIKRATVTVTITGTNQSISMTGAIN